MVRDEEKQFEEKVNELIDKAKNIKISLVYFIQRIETEGDTMNWPQVLDAFTSICGQINTLMRYTRENRAQFIENRVVLPLQLSPDRDEELVKLTEGRVQLVNHEMVPDYLRTKPDPEIEELDKNLQIKASTISPDAATKQVSAANKLIENIINFLQSSSVRVDTEMSRQSIRPSFIPNETNELIMAVSTGRGLAMSGPQQRPLHADGPVGSKVDQQRQQAKQNIRAPELKTSIKPAT